MIPLGFRLAAASNVLGVLIFSMGFSNDRLVSESPVVFSRFGLVCIVLWGLAYLATAKAAELVPALAAVFALEKLVYSVTWFAWLGEHGASFPRLFSESPLTATFYAIYGPNDILFGLFFAYVAIRGLRARPAGPER